MGLRFDEIWWSDTSRGSRGVRWNRLYLASHYPDIKGCTLTRTPWS